MKVFSQAIAAGALGSLEQLGLDGNKIGDEGMMALASVIAGGALASPNAAAMAVVLW